ncbi:MAG: hypothetical protein ACSHX8_13915 [Opitutaceae bacterium]
MKKKNDHFETTATYSGVASLAATAGAAALSSIPPVSGVFIAGAVISGAYAAYNVYKGKKEDYIILSNSRPPEQTKDENKTE